MKTERGRLQHRILIADDDAFFLKGISDFLHSTHGHSVDAVVSGEEALEKVRQAKAGDYAVVVLDHYFKEGLDGLDVLSQIRKLQPDLPVIFLTGIAFEIGADALELGAYSYLTKPIANEELAAMIEGLLQQDVALRQLATTVCEVLDAPLCLIGVLDEAREQFKIRAWDGRLDEEYRQSVALDYHDPATQGFLRAGSPLALADVTDPRKAKHYRHAAEAGEREWRSLLSSPMICQGRVVGILDVYSIGEVRRFDERDKRLIRGFASQAAAIVHNDLLNRRSQALAEINRLLSGAYDLKAMLDLILAKVLRLVGTNTGWLYLLDREDNKLRIHAYRGLKGAQVHRARKLGQGVTGWVAQHGEAQLVPDVREDERYIAARRRDIRSEIVVPLKREDVVLGVLAAKSTYLEAFTEDDMAVLSTFATQAALAVERDKLTRHVQEVSRLALSENLDELADYVAGAVHDLTGLSVALWLMDERERVLRIKAHRGLRKAYARKATTPLDGSITAKAFGEKQMLWRRDVQNDREEPQFYHLDEARRQGWHFFICVPLLGRDGQPLGSLSLYGLRPQQCSESQKTLLWTFANQAAMAFESVWRQRNLERLVQTGRVAVEQIADEAQILEQFVEQIREATGAPCAVIYPYEAEYKRFFDKDRIVVSGLLDDKRKVTDKPREKGMAAIVRHTSKIVVHDLDAGDMEEIDFSAVPEQPTRDQLLKFISEEKFIEREEIKAFVGMSLRATGYAGADEEQEEVGVLYVNYREPHRFTSSELDLIQSYAQQAANLIHAARLWARLQSQLGLSQLLVDASKAIGQATTRDDILKTVFQQAFRLTGRTTGSVMSIESDRRLRIVYSEEVSEEAKAKFHGRPTYAHEGSFGIVTRTGEIFESENTEKDLKEYRMIDVGLPIPRQLTNVPLKCEGNVVGILVLDTVAPNERVKSALLALGEMAGAALGRARDLEVVSRVTEAVESKLEEQDLLQAIVDQVATELNCTHCAFYMPVESSTESHVIWLEPRVFCDRRPNKTLDRHFRTGEGIAGWVFQYGESVLLADARADERFAPTKDESTEPLSMLVVPVKVAEQTIGVVCADQHGYGWFKDSDRRLLEILARHAGIAIERAAGLKLLQNIGQQIISAQRVDEILKHIVAGAIRLTNTTSGVIFLLSEDRQAVIKDYQYPPNFNPPPPRIGKKTGLTHLMVIDPQPIVVPDIHEDERVNPDLRKFGVQSLIGIPLRLEQQVIGALYLNDADRHDFTDTEVSLLTTLASQAAIAIQKAQLFERIQKQKDAQTEAVGAIARSIAAPMGLQEVLDGILTWTVSLMGKANLGEVRLLDQKTNELVATASRGERIREQYRRIPVGEGITGWVAEHKESQMVPDVSKDRRYLPFVEGISSELAVPMLKEGKLIGVLNIEHPQINAFAKGDVELAEAIAGLAVVAIENAQLYEQRVSDIAALQEINEAVISEELDDVLRLVVDKVVEVMPGEYSSLWLKEQDTGDLMLKAIHRPLEGEIREVGRIRAGEDSICMRVVQTGKPNICEDVEKEPGFYRIYLDAKSSVTVPLKYRDVVIGALNIESPELRAFTEEHRRLLVGFADQAAIAIENALLYAEIIQRLNQLEVQTGIYEKIIAAGIKDIDRIPDLLYKEAAKVMDLGDAQVQIAFYSQDKDEVTFPLAVEQDNGVIIDVVRWGKREANYRKPDEYAEVEQFKPRTRREPPGLTEYVIRTERPVLIVKDFAQETEELGIKVWPRFGRLERPTHSWLGVPMIVQDRVIGIISIQSLEAERAYDRDDVELLSTVANQAAVAIENVRLYQDLGQKVEELKQAQNRLLTAERLTLMSQVAAEFVHRLGNLIGTIPVRIALIKERLDPADASDRAVLRIAEGIRTDTEGLLQFARDLERPSIKLSLEPVDLNQLVRNAVVQRGVPSNVHLVENLSPNIPDVRGPKDHLLETLKNLIGNAIDAMPDGGTLSITTQLLTHNGHGFVELDVSDTGHGISLEDQERVFELFYTTKPEGLGFGLWRDKNLLETLGGEIKVKSEPKKGSTFIVLIPVDR